MDETETKQLQTKVDEIKSVLEEAKAAGWNLNEADTERIIIDPLLHALGYGPLDIRKRGHDSVANNFPDYTLLPHQPQKWFLEVKKLDLSLQDGEAAQAVNYANNQGAEWAVLTNGRKWFIYNAHLPKPLTEKRVFQIDDLFSSEGDLKTLAFLSRASMLSGGLTHAWTYEQVQRIVKAQMEMPNSAVRKRLRQVITDEVKTLVSEVLIEQALYSAYTTIPSAIVRQDDLSPTRSQTIQVAHNSSPSVLHTFTEIAADSSLGTGRKPVRLQFSDGSSADVTTWADAAISVLTYVGKHHGLPSLPFSNRAKGKTYFLNTDPIHSTGLSMKSHRKILLNSSAVYMDTNRSTQEIIASLLMLFATVGAPKDIVKVSVR